MTFFLTPRCENRQMLAVAHHSRIHIFDTTPRKGEVSVMSAGSRVNMARGMPVCRLTARVASISSPAGTYSPNSSFR
ncbi:hypothetical protein A7E75_03950 [Syntrophotalea acetylenica]|uniref:Uncharacterized protein n=1 Tax=Syntrophotalea acetylenica TaxID=29542 RepID=A0A1L3GEB2_SYNAC|nr:hypothetical protein A7E75_03950 [Syntrophotalea acetylenica]